MIPRAMLRQLRSLTPSPATHSQYSTGCNERVLGFGLAYLLGFVDRLLELLDCAELRPTQGVLRHVAPDRRRIERILHSAPIDFEGILRRANLVAEVRPSIRRSAQTWICEIRTTVLTRSADVSPARLIDDRPVIHG